MIETTQEVVVSAPLGAVWAHASDVSRWAAIMPGYRECELVDADNSKWVLKVGVGGLVRTVRVNVTVERWAGPEEVDFRYELEGDPVAGSGTYRASAVSEDETRMELHVQVRGSGPLAPMWEAMGGPLLPRFAAGFAGQLKGAIEAELGVAAPEPAPSGKFRKWFGKRQEAADQ